MKKKIRAVRRDTSLSKKRDTAFGEYLDAAIEIEKHNYHSNLKSFTAFEQELRSKMTDAFHYFQRSFSNGYRVVIEELRAESDPALSIVRVDPENLKIFDDPEKLMQALEAGNSIYQLLGFSEEALQVFYGISRRLLERNAFARARDVCYFLTIIAPQVAHFWVCLGRCNVGLGAYEAALQIFLQAIDVNPGDPIAYLDAITLLMQAHDFHRASGLCNAGIRFATDHHAEAWSKPLRSILEEKMKDITIALSGVQAQTS